MKWLDNIKASANAFKDWGRCRWTDRRGGTLRQVGGGGIMTQCGLRDWALGGLESGSRDFLEGR